MIIGDSNKSTHIWGIDLLRVAAVLLVMSYHYLFWNWRPGQIFHNTIGGGPGCSNMLHFGWVGVEIFFVISGYVIAFSASNSCPAAFLQSRFTRLAPANWIGSTIVLLCFYAIGTVSISVLAMKYLKTILFWPFDAIDGPWWTLGIEIVFYVVVYWLMRARELWQLENIMTRWSAITLLFWITALSLTSILSRSDGPTFKFLMDLVLRSEGNRILQLLLIQHAAFFAFGVILFAISQAGFSLRRLYSLIVIVPACLLEIFAQNSIIARAGRLDTSPLPALLVWIFAMILLVIAVWYNEAISIRWKGRMHALRFAGIATYPMYLIHNGVGALFIIYLYRYIGNASIALAMVCSGVFALLISWKAEPAGRSMIFNVWPRKR